jgi:hypothetical protein
VSTQKQRVDEEGRVFCPLKGASVALEGCLFCPRQVDFDLDGRRPFIICRVPDGQQSSEAHVSGKARPPV